MTLTDKARRLAQDLETLLDGADAASRDNPAVADKLSAQEIRVIQAVGKEPCCPMSKIAGAIRLSLSSVTGLIDRLFEKKLVRRDRSADDRRVVQVELTDAGRQLHEAALEGRAAFARDVLSSLSAAEQEALVSLLDKVSRRLKEQRTRA
jgi:MarR family transcriptional regulator, 2-MHQ and catechol-resistance regulon repressor